MSAVESHSATEAPPLSPFELKLVFGGLLSAMILASLDMNIVNTALPRIARELGGLTYLSWVVTAFMLTTTSTTPLYGKLSDMYGRKRLFLVAITIFVCASMLCGLAQSMTELIAFRALQGLGAGGLMVLAQSVIGDVVKPVERGRYQSLIAGAFAISSITGPPLGGFITTAWSWRWVFYVNVPIGVLSCALILFGLPRQRRAGRHRIDYAGAALIASATAGILLVLNWGGTSFDWTSPEILGLVAAVVILFALFLFQERRAAEPIVRLSLLVNHSLALGLAASIAIGVAIFGEFVFLPVYYQLVLGQTPAGAGAMMLPQVVAATTSTFIGGRFMTTNARTRAILLGGLSIGAVSLLALAGLAWSKGGLVYFGITIAGVGMAVGVSMPCLTVLVQNSVEYRYLGSATALLSFCRSMGAAVGVALAGGIAAHWLHGLSLAEAPGQALPPALAEGYQHAIGTVLVVSAMGMVLAGLCVQRLPWRASRVAAA